MFAALLMKAAMPLLATASAQAQGKALVEVCSVYGVTTIAVEGGPPSQGSSSDGKVPHARDHCVVAGVILLGMPALRSQIGAAPLPALPPFTLPDLSDGGPDAHAMWVARLKHGPPNFS